MILSLLLCVLGVLVAGLVFGRGFATLHGQGRVPLVPVLGHAAVSAVLVMLSVLQDSSELGLQWLTVATASLVGLAVGALLLRAPAAAPGPRRRREAQRRTHPV